MTDLEAETKRALQVAEMKRAHKAIEDIEKERKRANVFSAMKRVELHFNSISILVDTVDKANASISKDIEEVINLTLKDINEAIEKTHLAKFLEAQTNAKVIFGDIDTSKLSHKMAKEADDHIMSVWLPIAKQISGILDSLRHDYQKALDIGDREFNVLFPKLGISLNNWKDTRSDLVALMMQEQHMIVYCQRALS